MSSIKLAVELPVSLFSLCTLTDYDFVIASYCNENEDYMEFYKDIKKLDRERPVPLRWMILDNGAFENGKSMTFDDYMEIVEALRPHEVVLPDVVNDARATVEQSEEFLNKSFGKTHGSFMGVLQGESINDYLYCLEYYLRQSEVYKIRSIGIPYHLFYRPTLLRKTNIIKLCKSHNVYIHILGLPNPYEILDLKKFGKIITSIDTSLPVSAAAQGMLLKRDEWPLGGRVPITHPTNDAMKFRTAENIKSLQKLCSGK